EIIPAKRNQMTGQKPAKSPLQMVFTDDLKDQVRIEPAKLPQKPMTEHGNDEHPMHKREHAVMNAKEGNQKQFADAKNDLEGSGHILRPDPGKQYLQHIEAADDDVLQPEQKYQRKNVPLKNKQPRHWHQVGDDDAED
ncbi:MAG TPA: hypothetical protein VFB72_06865, partial [Verrucomicrobiae bacterium]|nr:hypothetical protein [Verrucomicrobiae bacterium]